MKVKSIDFSKLRNAEYLQFIRQVIQISTLNTINQMAIKNQLAELSVQLHKLESLHKLPTASKFTKKIEMLDERRAKALIALGKIVDGFACSVNNTEQRAGKLLQESIQRYGKSTSQIARLNYSSETVILSMLLTYWKKNTVLAKAINTLNVQSFVTELEKTNKGLNDEYHKRVKEYASASTETFKSLRQETKAKYYALRTLLEAHYTINPTPMLTKLIHVLNELIQEYNDLLHIRKAKNAKKTNI